jgi:NAD(P)-dependent dehydrogenase (short-subunit alcohol dehydrogenase family)
MSVRHAVVTGGGTGIGSAIAVELAAAGMNVSVMGRRITPLQKIADTINTGSERIQCQAIACDVTDEKAVASAFAEATEHFGAVDILVNNAGVAPTAPFHKISLQDWRAVTAVNLDSVFLCTQQVLQNMQTQAWGRVINIASSAAQKGYAYVSAYCAAKHGVLGLTRALALENATKGVTVNAICPGYTDTDIIRESVATIMQKTGRSEDEALLTFTASNPQGRLVKPAEVAASVLWLCADSSAAVTGQAISVSGGEVM